MGLLERCHSYKDKIAKGLPTNHGLFAYPVLMAADILIYDADSVPVGRDQKQHVEVTRDLAAKFNQTYGDTFKLPKPAIRKGVEAIPGLDGQKMSKSYNNTIDIFGEEKATRKKVMSIVMDSRTREEPKPDAEENRAIQLIKHLASDEDYAEEVEKLKVGGYGYGDLKKQLFELYWDYFQQARERRAELIPSLGRTQLVLAPVVDARADAVADERVRVQVRRLEEDKGVERADRDRPRHARQPPPPLEPQPRHQHGA